MFRFLYTCFLVQISCTKSQTLPNLRLLTTSRHLSSSSSLLLHWRSIGAISSAVFSSISCMIRETGALWFPWTAMFIIPILWRCPCQPRDLAFFGIAEGKNNFIVIAFLRDDATLGRGIPEKMRPEDTRFTWTSDRARVDMFPRNQMHSSVLWCLSILKIHARTLGFNVQNLH